MTVSVTGSGPERIMSNELALVTKVGNTTVYNRY